MPFAPGWNPGEQTDSFVSPFFDVSCVPLGGDPLKSLFPDDLVYLAPGNILDLAFSSDGTGSYKHHILVNTDPIEWIIEEVTYGVENTTVLVQGYSIPGLLYKFEADLSSGAKSKIFIRLGD